MSEGKFQVIKNCEIGEGTKIWHFVNLYDCKIGKNCMIGSFVEVQPDVKIGDNTRIQSHTLICSKAEIGKNVFIGHGTVFVNDLYPPSEGNWKKVVVKDDASIGSNATILPVKIGKNALVGAGSVVTKDVPANTIVAGNPAREIGKLKPGTKKKIE